jgi:hypothetical protein
MQPEGVVQHAFAHRGHGFGDVLGFQQLVALRIDDLALIVGDVIVFEKLLADVEVAGLDLALRRFQRTRDERMLDRLAFGHLQPFHDRFQAITGKDAQQRVVEREVEARRTRVPLATRTAAQLVVDTPRLMSLGADDVQAAGRNHLVVQLLPLRADLGDARIALGLGQRFVVADLGDLLLDTAAENDVGTAASHVGGNGDHSRPAGLTHDLGLARMLLGVEHLMRQFFVVEQRREQFGVLDRGRADQHRLAAFTAATDVGDDRGVFPSPCGKPDRCCRCAASAGWSG